MIPKTVYCEHCGEDIQFTESEKEFIKNVLKLDLDYDNLTDDDWIMLEDTAGDYLVLRCLDKGYNPNAEGLICEAILDKLP